ncbi:unnamed protein product (macronuclear) [Paramecium tetraurelia]|uniref:Uncharacterized protein n=1 Tax=Paramecium tetraurelia TaxID=5888 RepID=A0D7K9_PARTE|nr:uncharacterized protein GSPATT00013993001 [Paramecium tetraurelia]CAK79026.1 unnamed protein product [Paramecium tetraurelia]|eukprot:XP_001446423.1 hypothetical protein (macronuclear) [Paramecium tetraurelia strain d4-2]
MLKGQHQLPDFIAVILVYGIIFSEYYAFVFIFLPAFLNKHGSITYLIGIEFTIIFIFLNLAYIMIQYTKPGYPPKDLVFALMTLRLNIIMKELWKTLNKEQKK